MGFLYRLAAAVGIAIVFALFALVVLHTAVSPGQFYGGIVLGVALSYADDFRLRRLARRIARSGF